VRVTVEERLIPPTGSSIKENFIAVRFGNYTKGVNGIVMYQQASPWVDKRQFIGIIPSP